MEANELLRIQHEVTSERNPEKRRAAIEHAIFPEERAQRAEIERSHGRRLTSGLRVQEWSSKTAPGQFCFAWCEQGDP